MSESKMFDKLDDNIPSAKKEVKSLVTHGDERIDNYYWLNQRENPEVIEYLKDENAYLERVMSHTKNYRKDLFEELKSRIKKDDSSVPYRKKGFYYATQYQTDNEYPIYTRGKIESGDDEVLLDQNELAEGHSYYSIRGRQVSPNNRFLLFGEDTLSRRIYKIRIKDLKSGRFLSDEIPNTSANAVWANDNKTIFYTVKDETLRPHKVYRHVVGTPISEDELIYHETDDTYVTYVSRSNSEEYIMIGSYSTLSTEIRFLSANDPMGEFKVFQPRQRDLEYEVEHADGGFYIRTNKDAKNFQIMHTTLDKTGAEHWKPVIPHRSDVLVEDLETFKEFMVITERQGGNLKIKIRNYSGEEHFIDFDDDVFTAYLSNNYDFDTDKVRVWYTSLKTPGTTYDYSVSNRSLTLLKQEEVLGGFSSDSYKTYRVHATASDGVKIPISIVQRKEIENNGTAPLYLIGYGSYGASYDPTFSSVRLSLLDRGFVVAIAHIRGGEEMGRGWYEDGKLLKKKNTFTDFIACADYLIAEKIADPNRVFAYGGSAGGLLMGAVTNMRPDLWAGVVSAVPFVDVVTTMLDASIPLTTGEYDEWGNPNDSVYYHYIKSYSPYDNIEAKAYPPILVTTGLHDSQVQYWEPAKYVAKMRELKTDKNPLLFHTNLEAGHGGTSGRFARLEEWALHMTFILDLAGELTMPAQLPEKG